MLPNSIPPGAPSSTDERPLPADSILRQPPAPRWLIWAGLFALAGYLLFLWPRITAAAGASDSSGYLNGARLLSEGKLRGKLRMPPEFHPPKADDQRIFTPLGFVTSPVLTEMTPAYATGLPLHFAISARLLGWNFGPRVVELLAAALALWLCYLVGREAGLSTSLALAAAAALAVCPIFFFTSIQALSDTLATTWSLAAFYCALRARRSMRWAAACGAALSIAVLVRLTNLLLAPALIVLLGLDWRRLLRFVLAGIPAAAWLAFYNRAQFGSIGATGYGSVAADFSLANGAPTLVHFAKWLAVLLPGILLVLPLAAAMHGLTRSRSLFALGTAFGSIAGFYLFYDISQQVWWCLRYILPVVPFLIVAGLLGIEALARGPGARWPRVFRPAAAFMIGAWAIAGSWYWTSHLHVFMVEQYEQTYADASLAARERLPHNALVAANNFSGALHFYTDFPVLRADLVEAPEFSRYAGIARHAGRPVCAVLFEFEEEEAFRRCPGKWKQLSTFRNVGYWRLE